MKRLYEIDALRGAAVLCVVLYHYFFRYNELYGHKGIDSSWIESGHFGVELFFIISGFVIYWTLDSTEKPLDFIISRFSRLYPIYWVAVLTTYVFILCFGLEGRETDLYDALLNLVMFHEYFRVPHVDGVYWSLTVELTFYFWIFVLYLFNKSDKADLYAIPILLISITSFSGLVHYPGEIYKLFILKSIPFFTAGICFFKIKNTRENYQTYVALILSLLATIPIYGLEYFYVFIGMFLLFYLLITDFLKFLNNKYFIYLGGISYSLYLLHQNIGYIIINEMYKYQLPGWLAISSALFATISLSIIFTYKIERPIIKKIRFFYNNNLNFQRCRAKLSFNSKTDSNINKV
jgi:peptidoglycan/LPS O-acetylase OafA/YrhL